MANHDSPNLVSVIIPTYQGDRFIAQALANVADQTWTNWELIVIEDGSQGETEAIVRRFAEEHPNHHIQYIRQPRNLGQSTARNNAMQVARGKWVAFLDVDDRWVPTHLTASLDALTREEAGLAYSTVIMFDDRTGLTIGTWGPTKKDLDEFPLSLFHRCFITPSSVVMSRDIFHLIGGQEPDLGSCEDLDYWIRAAAAGVKFSHVRGCHVLYRKNHPGAQTAGTCRTTETFARVLERHLTTLPNTPSNQISKVARMYFSAAWCHAITNRRQDPTADPSRTGRLLWRAWELHRSKTKYWIHATLFQCCERLQSNLLQKAFLKWFKPRKVFRLGQLAPVS